jgi:hypothetical protein
VNKVTSLYGEKTDGLICVKICIPRGIFYVTFTGGVELVHSTDSCKRHS